MYLHIGMPSADATIRTSAKETLNLRSSTACHSHLQENYNITNLHDMNILIQESTDKSLTKSQRLTQLVDQKELFAWLINRTFLANEQYFSLTTNQPTVLSAMAYQPSEQGTCSTCTTGRSQDIVSQSQ